MIRSLLLLLALGCGAAEAVRLSKLRSAFPDLPVASQVREFFDLTAEEDVREKLSFTVGGVKVHRFMQTFRGIDVYGSNLPVASDDSVPRRRFWRQLGGEKIGLNLRVAAKLLKEQPLDIKAVGNGCIAAVGLNSKTSAFTSQQMWHVEEGFTRLIHRVEVTSNDGVSAFVCVQDAMTGEVYNHWSTIAKIIPEDIADQIREQRAASARAAPAEPRRWEYDLPMRTDFPDGGGYGGNVAIGRLEYGVDRPLLPVERLLGGNTCNLKTDTITLFNQVNGSTVLDPYIPEVVRPLYNAIFPPFSQPDYEAFDPDVFSYDCSLGSQDAVNGAYGPANDCYYAAVQSENMYRDWYDMDIVMPYYAQPRIVVHFGEDYLNAFWNPAYSVFAFGDGDYMVNVSNPQSYEFMPFCSALDVIGHELAHSFTSAFSGLEYTSDSGCLNEAYSDLQGEAVEAYSGGNDWLIGANMTTEDNPRQSLRSMIDPTTDGVSLDHYDQMYPRCNPHYCSGILNHVFYLYTTTSGLTVQDSFEPFMLANSILWGQTTSYLRAARDVVKAAEMLGLDTAPLIAAFEAVGLSAAPADNSDEPDFCVTRPMEITLAQNQIVKYRMDLPPAADSCSEHYEVDVWTKGGKGALQLTAVLNEARLELLPGQDQYKSYKGWSTEQHISATASPGDYFTIFVQARSPISAVTLKWCYTSSPKCASPMRQLTGSSTSVTAGAAALLAFLAAY